MTTYRVTITKSVDLLIEAASADEAEYAAVDWRSRDYVDWSDADTEAVAAAAHGEVADLYVTADGGLGDTATRRLPVDPTGAPWIAGLTSRQHHALDARATYGVDDLAVWTDGVALLAGPRTADRPAFPRAETADCVRAWARHVGSPAIEINRADLAAWLAKQTERYVRVAGVLIDRDRFAPVLAALKADSLTGSHLPMDELPALHLRAGDVFAIVMACRGGENAPAFGSLP